MCSAQAAQRVMRITGLGAHACHLTQKELNERSHCITRTELKAVCNLIQFHFTLLQIFSKICFFSFLYP